MVVGCQPSLTHRPPLPPGIFLVLIFSRGWVDPRAMVWSEGNMSLKNPVTPAGIDPGTIRLVAQRLNHYATPGMGHNGNAHLAEKVYSPENLETWESKLQDPVRDGTSLHRKNNSVPNVTDRCHSKFVILGLAVYLTQNVLNSIII